MTITLRGTKGSALTHNELDGNFTDLDTNKLALTDISVTQATASGSGTLTYDNSTGVFTYTPPDLSASGYTDANVTTFLNGNLDTNIIADTDNTYDLGVSTQDPNNGEYSGTYFRSMYLKGGIYWAGADPVFSLTGLTFDAVNQAIGTDGGLKASTFMNPDSYLTIAAGSNGTIFLNDNTAGGTMAILQSNGAGALQFVDGANYNGPRMSVDTDQPNMSIGAKVTKAVASVFTGASTQVVFNDGMYYAPGSTVVFSNIGGTTQLNGNTYYINETGDLFTDAAMSTALDSTAFGAYTSGGTGVIDSKATMSLPVIHSAPTTPRSGMMAVADGTNWNPTATGTETLVVYLGGAWRTVANA
jgi:hypothetical protein